MLTVLLQIFQVQYLNSPLTFLLTCLFVCLFVCLFRCNQLSCLATGRDTPFHGGVEIRDNTILGWVSEAVSVKIMLNNKCIETIIMAQLLEQPDGRLGFKRELTDEENSPGLKLLRVYGLVNDVCK